ncbi:MAG: insulinase family protein [Pirellulaceae bacterium]|nr:insulinase family protein [Pirellulaceae bacterium]
MLDFTNYRLDNGLEVLVEKNKHAYSTSLGYFVNTGSRDENDANWGVSHYLEHMLFKGSENRSAEEVNTAIDRYGASCNAFTSEEHTVYYATIIAEYQSEVTALLTDFMRPALRSEDFEMEKQVILEEIKKYEDQPPFGAYEKCMQKHFEGHYLGRSVLGTVESVTALTPEAMRDYFQKRYHPGNLVFVATGNVDEKRLLEELAKETESWKPRESSRHLARHQGSGGFASIVKKEATQQYLLQVSNGPAASDNDRYAARLLCTMLGDETGSRLYWQLVETGLAEYAVMGAYEYQDTGLLFTYLSCRPEEGEKNWESLAQIQNEVASTGFQEEELQRAKSKYCSHLAIQAEKSGNRMFQVGNNWLQRGCYVPLPESLSKYQGVTLEEVQAVFADHPLQENTVLSVGPREIQAPTTC